MTVRKVHYMRKVHYRDSVFLPAVKAANNFLSIDAIKHKDISDILRQNGLTDLQTNGKDNLISGDWRNVSPPWPTFRYDERLGKVVNDYDTYADVMQFMKVVAAMTWVLCFTRVLFQYECYIILFIINAHRRSIAAQPAWVHRIFGLGRHSRRVIFTSRSGRDVARAAT